MLFLVAAFLLTAATGSDFADHMRRGIEETKQAQYANAMLDLQAAMRLNPAAPEVYLRMGLLLGQMTNFRDAEIAFRRAIALKPSFAEAHYNLGLTQIANPQSKLDWPAAISSFRTALQYRPDYAEAANYLGAGLMATGDIDGAISTLRKAVQLKPGLAEAQFNLGLALEEKEHPAEAESAYQKAVDARNGNYPEALTALGKLLLHEGKVSAAEKELLAALRANPDSSDAHYALAKLRHSEIEFDVVRDLAQRKTDALQSARITNEGLQAAAKGDSETALDLERQAVSLKPDFGIPHYNLALILADRNDWDAAAHELVKAASLIPGNAAPWFDLGRVLRQKGDAHGSFAALNWAARLAPSDARIGVELQKLKSEGSEPASHPPFGPTADTAAEHLAFASQLAALGDYLGEAGELLRVLALKPANEKARRLLVTAYLHLKLTHEALLEQAKADFVTHP